MISRSVGITAVCAVVTHALLIPPGVSNIDLVNPVVNPKARSIQLPCPSCSSPVEVEEIEDGDQIWSQSRINEVNLSFDISNDGQRLELNGEAVYPLSFHREAYMGGHPLYVTQVSPSGHVTPLEVTSSGLTVESEQPVSDDGDAIILLRFQIMSLEMRQMDAFLEVAIDLLKTSDGELFIVTVENLPRLESPEPTTPPPLPPSEAKDCDVLPSQMCQLKKLLLSKIEAIRFGKSAPPTPCDYHIDRPGQSLPYGKPPHGHGHYDEQLDYYGNPNLSRPYYDYHRHHYLQSFAKGVIAILIPILAGITVGLFVSFLGLLIGRLIGYLWVKFARGDRRGNASYARYDLNYDDGKISIEEGRMEPLPPYEDAPAYEEIEGGSR